MESPQRRSAIWFVAASLCAVGALACLVYDRMKSDDTLLSEASTLLTVQFRRGIAALHTDPKANTSFPYCRLSYGADNRLFAWTNSSMLPTEGDLRRLKIEDAPLLNYNRRTYYQFRIARGDTTHVILVPLVISYEVNNQYLPRYQLLGSYSDDFSPIEKANLSISTGIKAELDQVKIVNAEGQVVMAYGRWPVKVMRRPIRFVTLLFTFFALVFMGFFAKISLAGRSASTLGSVSLIIAALALLGRWLLNTSPFLVDSFGGDLFSPRILAFHALAPSLGDFTLNVITLAVVIGALYTYLVRRMLPFSHRIIANPWLRIPVALLCWFLMAWMMKVFFNIFSSLTLNSQVEIQFSNFFKTSGYAFLILADLGLLLLVFLFVSLLLLKPIALSYRRSEDKGTYLAFHAMCAALALGFFFQTDWTLLVTGMLLLGLLLLTGIRQPFQHLIRHDLTNLLLLLTIASVMATAGLIRGQNKSTVSRTELIALRVLGAEGTKLGSQFERAQFRMDEEKDEVQLRYNTLSRNAFREWLREHYFVENFRGSNVWVYLFNEKGIRLDRSSARNPTYDPRNGVKIEDIGERVAPNFFRLLNFDNNYTDIYIGIMAFRPLQGDPITITLELAPTETEGLFPSLSLDESALDNLRLVNRYDYAIYLDGLLYKEHGHTPFPVQLQEMPTYLGKDVDLPEGGKEHVADIGGNRTVVVRYDDQSPLEIVTTLSFTFYFFTFLSLLLIAMPVLLLRFAQERRLLFQFPIRARIRFWLLLISLLPLLGIVGLLTPFIRERYTNQAREELSDETSRIAQLLTPYYRLLVSDVVTRFSQGEAFRNRVQDLETLVSNDIHVYDQEGVLVASTQPLLFASGIISELMNDNAFEQMSQGESSELVIEEKVGNLSYLSAYRPILGGGTQPLGYVNISYLARQDALEDQVFSFIAYLSNIYLLVFLLVNLAAVVVADTISKPLSLIRQRLSTLGMGRRAEPIVYESDDEIGALVKSYNEMVGQLVASEEKLAQSEREMAWKQMARQVAHEIKNPLTPMKLSIQMLRRTWKENDKERLEKQFPRTMDTLLSQIESMVRIANSFSEFARMPEAEKTTLDLNDILYEVADLFSSTEGIRWNLQIPEAHVIMDADRDQITRTFQNIVLNAIQAMDGEGEITIGLTPQNGVALVSIRDNGPGMSEEIQQRAFEPSFSTKNSGMGLGLAIVKRIVENSNGKIWFESQPGQGTVFFIELPVRAEHEEA